MVPSCRPPWKICVVVVGAGAVAVDKAVFTLIGKKVMDVSGHQPVLMVLPHGSIKEIRDAAGRRPHIGRRAERAERFGKMSCGRTVYHGSPDISLLIARLGHAADVAIGQVFDLVIVVEHHAPVARDAEVLVEHVTREDIGGDQFLDRVAVLDDAVLDLLVGTLLEPEVERRHAALDIDVPHHDLLPAVAAALVLDHRRRVGFQLAHQRFVEARQREAPRPNTPAYRPCAPPGRAASRADISTPPARAWFPSGGAKTSRMTLNT